MSPAFRFCVGLTLVVLASCGALANGRSASSVVSHDPSFATAPTIESVSREAQREIRACPDSVAFQCVADVLTRYAASLHQIAQERANRPTPIHCRRAAGRLCAGQGGD
ncbi:MAG TPA: hypothetical protein VKS78_15815 [Roseiarcus sp.]|nr:hypothetical protein [Roseiarcus sp.]